MASTSIPTPAPAAAAAADAAPPQLAKAAIRSISLFRGAASM